MEILGTVRGVCDETSQPHTKKSACAVFEGIVDALYFTSPDARFDTDEDTFNTELAEGVYKSGVGRVIPVTDVIAVNRNGGDIKTSQEGWGPEMPIGTNSVREDFTILVGGECAFKQLSKMNKRAMRVFRKDQASMNFGTCVKEGGEEKFKGYLLDSVYVTRRDANESNPGAIILSLFYSASYEAERRNVHSVMLNENIEGLTGVYLERGTAPGKAKVKTVCSADDITSVYGSKFATATLFENPTGGHPTTVAYSNGELTFTPVGKYKIADAETLKAAMIEGIEGENIFTDLT